MHQNAKLAALGQVSRTVKSIDAATAWYRDVLGLEHLFTADRLAFFDCGGTRLMLSENEAPNETESILYFAVVDIRDAYNALLARGAESLQAPQMIHQHADGRQEWMAFFKDPEGRPLAIMS
jgi:methylmalonyl-CoA/ethylmalonyl-CoA epimerase